MKISEMKQHSGLVMVAEQIVKKKTKSRKHVIDRAIKRFGGNKDDFEKWAMSYLSGGKGVTG